jgi:hypothetical protein
MGEMQDAGLGNREEMIARYKAVCLENDRLTAELALNTERHGEVWDILVSPVLQRNWEQDGTLTCVARQCIQHFEMLLAASTAATNPTHSPRPTRKPDDGFENKGDSDGN